LAFFLSDFDFAPRAISRRDFDFAPRERFRA